MRNITYKETDKKLEVNIYGIPFEINTKELDNLDTNKVANGEGLDVLINKVLGEKATEIINNKRKEDGYEPLSTQSELTILTFLTETYVDSTVNNFNRIEKKVQHYKRKENRYRNNRYRR